MDEPPDPCEGSGWPGTELTVRRPIGLHASSSRGWSPPGLLLSRWTIATSADFVSWRVPRLRPRPLHRAGRRRDGGRRWRRHHQAQTASRHSGSGRGQVWRCGPSGASATSEAYHPASASARQGASAAHLRWQPQPGPSIVQRTMGSSTDGTTTLPCWSVDTDDDDDDDVVVVVVVIVHTDGGGPDIAETEEIRRRR